MGRNDDRIMALHRIIIKNAFYPRLLTINNAHSGIKDAARASTFALKSVTANNSKPISGENFEAKNKRLKRPISPHLSIYNFETTMAFSITHRFTGLALNGMLYGIAAGAILLPGSYPHYLAMVEAMHFGPAIIFTAKFLLAFPFGNGVRHLAWDMGYNLTNKGNRASGFVNL